MAEFFVGVVFTLGWISGLVFTYALGYKAAREEIGKASNRCLEDVANAYETALSDIDNRIGYMEEKQ